MTIKCHPRLHPLQLCAGFETQTNNSVSGSSESLNSLQSLQSNHNNNSPGFSPYDPALRKQHGRGPGTGPVYSNINVSELGR